MREKKFFFVSFSEFFRFLSESFSDFWPKNFKKLWKLLSACPQEQLVALKIFKKFWTVLDFLQKHLAWFSKFYLRVQSKNCGRNSFLIFLFRIFSDNERKFSDFWPKNFTSFQNYLLRVQKNSLWLDFFKFWIVSDFLQNSLAWFSKLYQRVQSKNSGKNSFFFLFGVVSNFERNFFRLLAKKFQKFEKISFCVSTGTTFGFKIF